MVSAGPPAAAISNTQTVDVSPILVHLRGSVRFRPASKHGLPFVAFTRSESFAMTAFKNPHGKTS